MTARRWVLPVLFFFCLGLPSAAQADFFATVPREPSVADRIQLGRTTDEDLTAILGNLDRIYSFPQDQGMPSFDSALADLGHDVLHGKALLHYHSDTGVGTIRIELEGGASADDQARIDLARGLCVSGQDDLRLLLFPSSMATLRQLHETVSLRRSPAFAFSLFSNLVEVEFRSEDRGGLPTRITGAGRDVAMAAEGIASAREKIPGAREAVVGLNSCLDSMRVPADPGSDSLRKLELARQTVRFGVERVRRRMDALRADVQAALDRLREARTSLQEWFQGGASGGSGSDIDKLKATIANLEHLGAGAETLGPMKKQLEALLRGMAADQGEKKDAPKVDVKPLLALMKAMGSSEKNLASAIKPLAAAERQATFAFALGAALAVVADAQGALAGDAAPSPEAAGAAREAVARFNALPAELAALGLDASGVREVWNGLSLKSVRAAAPLLAAALDDASGARAKLEATVKPLLEPAAKELGALQEKVLEAGVLLDKAASLVEPTSAMLAPLPDSYRLLAEGMTSDIRGPAFRLDPGYGLHEMRWKGAGEWSRVASATVLTRQKSQRAFLVWNGPHAVLVRGTGPVGEFAVPRCLLGVRRDPFDAPSMGAGMLLLPIEPVTGKTEARPLTVAARVLASAGAAQASEAAARAIPALEEIAKHAVFAVAALADALAGAADLAGKDPAKSAAAAARAVEAAEAAADAEATLRGAQIRFERMLAWVKHAEEQAEKAAAEPKALGALAAGKAAQAFAARAEKDGALLEFAARVSAAEAGRAERSRSEARSGAGPMWAQEADAFVPGPHPGLEYDPYDAATAADRREKFSADAATFADGLGKPSVAAHEARQALEAALARLEAARAVLGSFAGQSDELKKKSDERMAQAAAVARDPLAVSGEEPLPAGELKKLPASKLGDQVKDLQAAAGRTARAAAQTAQDAAGREADAWTREAAYFAARKESALGPCRKALAAALAAAKASGGVPTQVAAEFALADLASHPPVESKAAEGSFSEAQEARSQAIVAAAAAEVAEEEQARVFAVLQDATGTKPPTVEKNAELEDIRRLGSGSDLEALVVRLKKTAELGSDDPVGRLARQRLDGLIEDAALALEEAAEIARGDDPADRSRGRRLAARIDACLGAGAGK